MSAINNRRPVVPQPTPVVSRRGPRSLDELWQRQRDYNELARYFGVDNLSGEQRAKPAAWAIHREIVDILDGKIPDPRKGKPSNVGAWFVGVAIVLVLVLLAADAFLRPTYWILGQP